MPSAGMQYTQRRLQRSVIDSRRSRTVRPCVSVSGAREIIGCTSSNVESQRDQERGGAGARVMGEAVAQLAARLESAATRESDSRARAPARAERMPRVVGEVVEAH